MDIGALTSGSGGSSAASGKNLQSMTTDDFLKMLLTELTNQDPFEPVKNQDMLNQIGSIRKLEMDRKMDQTLTGLMLQGYLSAAGSLIGKMVAGLGGNDEQITGLVTGVRVVNSKVMLELDNGNQLGIENVTHIRKE